MHDVDFPGFQSVRLQKDKHSDRLQTLLGQMRCADFPRLLIFIWFGCFVWRLWVWSIKSLLCSGKQCLAQLKDNIRKAIMCLFRNKQAKQRNKTANN